MIIAESSTIHCPAMQLGCSQGVAGELCVCISWSNHPGATTKTQAKLGLPGGGCAISCNFLQFLGVRSPSLNPAMHHLVFLNPTFPGIPKDPVGNAAPFMHKYGPAISQMGPRPLGNLLDEGWARFLTALLVSSLSGSVPPLFRQRVDPGRRFRIEP